MSTVRKNRSATFEEISKNATKKLVDGLHDDGPDALEMALRMTETRIDP